MFYFASVILISLSVSFLCSLLEACLLSISHGDIAGMSVKKAAVWNNFKGNIQKPIAVILIVNTLAHTIGATLSGAQFARLYGPKWIVLFSFLFSFAMIQWTEILPKTLGVKYNRWIARAIAAPLAALIRIFTPALKVVEFVNLPFVGRKDKSDSFDAINELSVMAQFASINEFISKDQEQIISRTINLTDKKIKDIMIPRAEMKYLNSGMNLMQALIEAHIHNHTRFPLLNENSPNEILGYVNFKDIVSALRINPSDPSLGGIKRPLITLYEEDTFNSAFKKLTSGHQHIAIVKNEKQELAGMVTLEDLIEEITGDIKDEYDVLPEFIYPITDTRFMAGGGVKISKVNETMGLNLPDPELSANEWLIRKSGTSAKPESRFQYESVCFIVKKIRRTNINELIIEKK